MTKQIPPKQELEHKRITEKKSLKAISEEYDVSPSTIRKWLVHHNINLRPSKTELEYKYLVEKKSTITIGKEYDVSPQSVQRWLIKHDILTRHRFIVRPPKEELIELYAHHIVNELAAKYGCCSQTILKWFGEYGIQTRRGIAKNRTCRILKKHAEDLKDDPERLSTKFLQDLIGVKCK
jgi:transposase-like protein